MNTENTNADVEVVDVAPTRSLFATVAADSTAGPAPVPVAAEPSVEAPVVEVTEEDVVVVAAETQPVVDTVQESPVEPETAVVDAPVEPEAVAPVETPADTTVEAAPFTEADLIPAPKSVKELQAEKSKLDAELAARQKEEKKGVIAQIAAIVKTYGISVTELAAALGGVPNPRKGVKAPVLYKD